MAIRIIRHEAVPRTGSFEVRFADGRPSQYFYYDDVLAWRLRPDMLTSEAALEQAKAFARAERNGGSLSRPRGSPHGGHPRRKSDDTSPSLTGPTCAPSGD